MSAPSTAGHRVVLLPVAPRAGRSDAMVRRFRFARVRLDGREAARAEHRKRVTG